MNVAWSGSGKSIRVHRLTPVVAVFGCLRPQCRYCGDALVMRTLSKTRAIDALHAPVQRPRRDADMFPAAGVRAALRKPLRGVHLRGTPLSMTETADGPTRLLRDDSVTASIRGEYEIHCMTGCPFADAEGCGSTGLSGIVLVTGEKKPPGQAVSSSGGGSRSLLRDHPYFEAGSVTNPIRVRPRRAASLITCATER